MGTIALRNCPVRKRIPANVVTAYEATVFEVFGRFPAVLSLAETPGAHDCWLARNASGSAVIITASNPFSKLTAKDCNDAANGRLHGDAKALNLSTSAARRTDPLERWFEDSICVFDLPDAVLSTWLTRYGQNAALRVRMGQAPELVWH